MVLDPKFILKVALTLLFAAGLSCALTPLVKVVAKKIGAIDVPKDNRRMHKTPIPRLGGLAIFAGFLVSVLIFGEINREGQTILMVTHSVKAASHAGRVLFLRDGVVFHQLYRGGAAEHEFYQRILDAMNALSSPEPQGEFAGMEVSYHA